MTKYNTFISKQPIVGSDQSIINRIGEAQSYLGDRINEVKGKQNDLMNHVSDAETHIEKRIDEVKVIQANNLKALQDKQDTVLKRFEPLQQSLEKTIHDSSLMLNKSTLKNLELTEADLYDKIKEMLKATQDTVLQRFEPLQKSLEDSIHSSGEALDKSIHSGLDVLDKSLKKLDKSVQDYNHTLNIDFDKINGKLEYLEPLISNISYKVFEALQDPIVTIKELLQEINEKIKS